MDYWSIARWTPGEPGSPTVPPEVPLPRGREAHMAPSDLCRTWGAWARVVTVPPARGHGEMTTVIVGHVRVA